MKYNILISIVSWRYLNNVLNIIKKVENSMTNDDYLVIVETGGQRSNDVEQYIAEHSNIRIIYSKTNDGFAASHALSVKIMQEKNLDGILLLNPDLELRDNHIDILKTHIAESENKAVLGCPVLNHSGNILEVEYLGFPVPKSIENKKNTAIFRSLKSANALNPNKSTKDEELLLLLHLQTGKVKT